MQNSMKHKPSKNALGATKSNLHNNNKKKGRSSPNNTTQRIASWQLPITSTHQKWWWPLYQPPVSSSIESRRRHSQREATSRARRRRRSRRWRRIAPCGWGETLAWRGRWRRHGARRSPWTATSTKPSWNLPPSPGGWKMAMVADKSARRPTARIVHRWKGKAGTKQTRRVNGIYKILRSRPINIKTFLIFYIWLQNGFSIIKMEEIMKVDQKFVIKLHKEL